MSPNRPTSERLLDRADIAPGYDQAARLSAYCVNPTPGSRRNFAVVTRCGLLTRAVIV
jgi:predicted oxidoreductase